LLKAGHRYSSDFRIKVLIDFAMWFAGTGVYHDKIDIINCHENNKPDPSQAYISELLCRAWKVQGDMEVWYFKIYRNGKVQIVFFINYIIDIVSL